MLVTRVADGVFINRQRYPFIIRYVFIFLLKIQRYLDQVVSRRWRMTSNTLGMTPNEISDKKTDIRKKEEYGLSHI